MRRIDTLWTCPIHNLPQRRRAAQATSDGLTDVVGELSFNTPIVLADLAAIERSCTWCFESHRVQLVRLFLARNRKRAVLVFRAPDAESVRLACRHAQMPLERVWPCRQVCGRASR
jgi:hypothetical protein